MVAIAILGEPVGSTALAYIFLNEGLTLWKILGGISIFIGIVIALTRRYGTLTHELQSVDKAKRLSGASKGRFH